MGKDTYHHTFFEMLGNWSFGDYFKKEAIQWHWDLLTKVYKVDPSRLYATYFGGNEKSNLKPDEEARQFWLEYLPAERVLPFGKYWIYCIDLGFIMLHHVISIIHSKYWLIDAWMEMILPSLNIDDL